MLALAVADPEVHGSLLVEQDAAVVAGRLDPGAVPDAGPRLQRGDEGLVERFHDAADADLAGSDGVEAGGGHRRDEPIAPIGDEAAGEEHEAADEAAQGEHKEEGRIVHEQADAIGSVSKRSDSVRSTAE